MSYLLDKKLQRKKFLRAIFIVLALFLIFYFRNGVIRGLSYGSHKVFYPLFVFSRNLGGGVSKISDFFNSKKILIEENLKLKSEIEMNRAMIANYRTLFTENQDLKGILGRKNVKSSFVLASILMRPNKSLYDTLIVDVGKNYNIEKGDRVFADGNIPIGQVADVYANTSKVILFSSNGEKTPVIISGHSFSNDTSKNISLLAVGRGGGNFEIVLPRDFSLSKGDEAVLPGLIPSLLGTVETILSDPRDPFTKALLVAPVNIQELKFVEIES